jgi:GNAT superfamily N-acetyltransferase
MASNEAIRIRHAIPGDAAAVDALIRRSARVLGSSDYTRTEIEAALAGAWGLDHQLIQDGTLFVAEIGASLAGCGAWSFRRALFGGTSLSNRDLSRLDPNAEPAKIRMFFVDPDHARKGIGQRILDRCEREARNRGFTEVELGATIPGRRFYASRGYVTESTYDYECAPGVCLPVTVMRKRLG